MSIDFDFSEFNALNATIDVEIAGLIPNTRKAVERTAYRMRTDWRDFAKAANGGHHARGYPFAIDYEMLLDTDGQISAEVGANRSRGGQAALDTILEDARGSIRSAPQRNGDRALRNNLADFEHGILLAAGRVL